MSVPSSNARVAALHDEATPAESASSSERGRTYIEDDVVSVIARIAAENVDGVHQLGESSLRGVISRLGRHGGVDAEVGMKEAAVDVEIVVEFGYPIKDVSRSLREQIISTVETMTGRRVVEVNVFVTDVHVGKLERRHRRQLE
jgi:uncharacterized alkaline shock family protein YloU